MKQAFCIYFWTTTRKAFLETNKAFHEKKFISFVAAQSAFRNIYLEFQLDLYLIKIIKTLLQTCKKSLGHIFLGNFEKKIKYGYINYIPIRNILNDLPKSWFNEKKYVLSAINLIYSAT